MTLVVPKKVNPKAIKVIDAILSTFTPNELESMRMKSPESLDFRQQMIIVCGKKRPIYSAQESYERFNFLKEGFYEIYDGKKRMNNFWLEYCLRYLFV